jgi:hypothetical protein
MLPKMDIFDLGYATKMNKYATTDVMTTFHSD